MERIKTIVDFRKTLLLLLGMGVLLIAIGYRHRIHKSMARLGRAVVLLPFLHGVGWTQDASPAAQDQAPKATGPLHVEIIHPKLGFNVVPRSVRRIFAKVTNGTPNKIVWSVTRDAKLSSTSGNWVDVTAPDTGSECSVKGTDSYTVTSATQFSLTARSQENPDESATIVINVCHPAVRVHVVPFYSTLYSGQKADVQAFIWGSANRDVSWKIVSMPKGGDGSLADSENEDAVFSATVAGRYTR